MRFLNNKTELLKLIKISLVMNANFLHFLVFADYGLGMFQKKASCTARKHHFTKKILTRI